MSFTHKTVLQPGNLQLYAHQRSPSISPTPTVSSGMDLLRRRSRGTGFADAGAPFLPRITCTGLVFGSGFS
ncbi:hypothetical protein SNOG_11451 [Parastagonospora nodorum SN15]|uniref:Uncharacterized protein n=1 Tax=Phaeosphaeria nodorum (strain SN15 / ATCC MYA-4574 / FGSC 10173) TaxID=321614 RepID=Q0U9W3_PHANO|nr:hypothetical protein SNOG_11451 [Parastagonospora nodorum SN15]EAT81159.1 hypothetical protein SNOG_11451 [Parastagonospora nodorum SN15]